MNEAECFINHNLPAEREANYAIDICVKYVKWRDNCNILDVGCGTGNVTHDILLPLLPKSTNSVIGIDKKTSSIDYANNHYSIEGKLTFQAVNIIDDHHFFENHVEHFDHIVSFSCLHFVREQETALSNIYKMLKPGGNFSFSCVVNANVFILLEHIAKIEKWNPFVAQYVKYMSPYQFTPNPKEVLQKMLTMVGFRVVNLTIEPRPMNLPLSYFPGYFISHMPVEIPTDLHIDFELCTLDVIRQLKFNHFDDNDVEYCNNDYDTIVGHVTK